MSTKRVYIAGPVRGLDEKQVSEAFHQKQNELHVQGFSVTNPVDMVKFENRFRCPGYKLDDDKNRNATMRFCIKLLAECDEIHLLPGWKFSEGAQIEHKVAELLKIKIVYPD